MRRRPPARRGRGFGLQGQRCDRDLRLAGGGACRGADRGHHDRGLGGGKLALREGVAESGPECAAIYIADKLANLHDWRLVYAEVGERAVEFFKAPTLAARVRAWHADLEMGERVAPKLRFNSWLREELERFKRERRSQPGPPLNPRGKLIHNTTRAADRHCGSRTTG